MGCCHTTSAAPSLYEREQSECWEDVPPLTLTASSRSVAEPYLPRSPAANAGVNFAAAAAAAAMPQEAEEEPDKPISMAMEAQMRELLKGQHRLEMELERAKAEANAKNCELEVLRSGKHAQGGAASRRQTPSTAPQEAASQRYNTSSKLVPAHANLGYHSNLSTAFAVLKRAAGVATTWEQAVPSPLPARMTRQHAPRRATGAASLGGAAGPRGSGIPGHQMSSCGLFC